MSLDDVVNVQISRSAAAVSRAGFGTGLILGPNADTGTWGSDRIRSYTSAAAMLDDGFEATDPEYIAALRYFGQELKPTRLKVGRQLAAVAQVNTVDLNGAAQNATLYTVTINGTDFDYTSDADATEAEILGGLLAAINAGSEPVTASGGVTTLVLTADEAGVGFTVSVTANLTNTATTANVGVATDLPQIAAIDSDWYWLMITSRDTDAILAAAAYTESVRKVFVGCSDDSDIVTSATDDVASQLQDLSYARTMLMYSEDQDAMPEAALVGQLAPQDPGAWTAKFKTLAGVSVDDLTDTEIGFAKGKNAMVYTEVGGLGMTEEGKVASGEFLDVIVGVDWIHVNMQADVFQILMDNPKVPFTNQGIATIENAIRKRLQLAVQAQILAQDPAFTVTVPAAADVDPADKANRALTGITFAGTLAGAVHSVEIQGNVSV